jgi:hypothetical protein
MTDEQLATAVGVKRLDPYCLLKPRFLGVSDTDALLSSIDDDCHNGWRSRLLRLTDRETAVLYATDHVYGEVYRGLAKMALSGSAWADDLRVRFEERYLPVLRFVTAAAEGIAVGRMVTEVGSALDGERRKFLALLRNPAMTMIVAEHRDQFTRFGTEYVEATLSAQGRRLLVVDPAGADGDLVWDVTETLTLLCARGGASRVACAVESLNGDEP